MLIPRNWELAKRFYNKPENDFLELALFCCPKVFFMLLLKILTYRFGTWMYKSFFTVMSSFVLSGSFPKLPVKGQKSKRVRLQPKQMHVHQNKNQSTYLVKVKRFPTLPEGPQTIWRWAVYGQEQVEAWKREEQCREQQRRVGADENKAEATQPRKARRSSERCFTIMLHWRTITSRVKEDYTGLNRSSGWTRAFPHSLIWRPDGVVDPLIAKQRNVKLWWCSES